MTILAFALVLTLPTITFANLPCRMGGPVATSQNGAVQVSISAHGCRSHPLGIYTVTGGTRGEYTIDGGGGGVVFVSDTGRTVLFTANRPRASEHSILVYRDGYRLGEYPLTELLGADSRTLTEDRFVNVRLEGVTLVIDDLDGTELLRHHVSMLAYRG